MYPDELPTWFAISAFIFLNVMILITLRRDVVKLRKLDRELKSLEDR